ncbi:hypothetical protein V8F06_000408 [Rhypophila decipiens]
MGGGKLRPNGAKKPPTKQLSRQNPPRPSPTAPQGPAVTKDGLPINWPSETKYLTAPSYSKFVTSSQLDIIRKPPPPPPAPSSSSSSSVPLPSLEPVTGENDIIPLTFPSGPSPAVQIHRITDPNHPAYGQCGLFAARDLLPGELILPYYGVVHPGVVQVDTATEQPKRKDQSASSSPDDPVGGHEQFDESIQALSLGPEEALISEKEEREKERIQHEKSDYDLWLSREADLAVDGERMGNEARFINDYRGVPGKERENAELRLVWDERIGEWTMAVYVVPLGKKARQKILEAQNLAAERLKKKLNAAGGGKKASGGGGGGLVPMPSKMSSVGVIRKGEEILVSYGRGFWERRKDE